VLGTLGEQSDQEIDAAEIAVAEPGQPELTSGAISTSYNRPCITCYMHLTLYRGTGVAADRWVGFARGSTDP
jgi:hypothetical protein